MTPFPYWPSLPVKQLVFLKGKNEVFLKAKDTSEQLVAAPVQQDGYLSYQFYYNKAAKLIGYRFALEPVRASDTSFPKATGDIASESFPRVGEFSSLVLASYVPERKVTETNLGKFFVIYHDLNIRLLKYTSPDPYLTYGILMRSKLDKFV